MNNNRFVEICTFFVSNIIDSDQFNYAKSTEKYQCTNSNIAPHLLFISNRIIYVDFSKKFSPFLGFPISILCDNWILFEKSYLIPLNPSVWNSCRNLWMQFFVTYLRLRNTSMSKLDFNRLIYVWNLYSEFKLRISNTFER